MKLRINDTYRIESDSACLNYILIQNKAIVDKETELEKNIDVTIGYYGRISSLVNGLVEHRIKCTNDEVDTLKTIVSIVDELGKDLQQAIDSLNN